MEMEFDDAFRTALESEDELGLVVRAHIHIEASLNRFLDGRLPHASHLKKAQLEYSQTVYLAIALGLHAKYETPLLALGKLRNAFAHQPGMTLTDYRVKGLYKCFSGEDRELVQATYEKTRRGHSEGEVPVFGKLPPNSQFMILAIALRALLAVAIKQSLT